MAWHCQLSSCATAPAACTHSLLPGVQTLLAVYFFLAGIVVSQRPMLLAMPMASAACILLLGASAWASQLLVPAYR